MSLHHTAPAPPPTGGAGGMLSTSPATCRDSHAGETEVVTHALVFGFVQTNGREVTDVYNDGSRGHPMTSPTAHSPTSCC